MQPFETVYVDSAVVACEGESSGGHPRVFLNLGPDGKVECPYCSRTFILKRGGEAAASSAAHAHP